MEKKFGMCEIFAILRKNWIVITAVFLVVGLASAVFFTSFVDKTYKSTISVYICKKGEMTYSDALFSKEISTDAVVILNSSDSYISDSFCDFGEEQDNMSTTPFADLEKKGYNKRIIKSMLGYGVVKNTGVINISVVARDPKITKEIGDALSRSVASYLEDTIYGIQAKIISDAREGVVSSAPIVRNSVILALIAAVLTYCIYALIFILDNKIRDTENFKNKFDFPFLGEIPKASMKMYKPGEKLSTKYSGMKATTFRFFETFKSIRTSLFYILPKLNNNVFAISSPGAKEGKSTITFYLSVSIAEANAKVLVIDSDLRNPTISKYFGINNDSGLSNILNGKKTFDEVVKRDVISGLDILASGPIPENPSELLSSDTLQELLNEVKNKYDYVIIDTAPVNIVTDSLLLMDKISGIVIVSRYGSTSYAEMKKAVSSVKSVNGVVLGTVINDVVPLYKSREYKKYYKY